MIKPSQLLLANAGLALTLVGAAYGRATEHRPPKERDFLRQTATDFRKWSYVDVPLTANEESQLKPDATLVRRFRSPKGPIVELAVISGHKKRTVHTPAFCMAGGGWETLAQRDHVVLVKGRQIPAVQAVLMKDGRRQVMTYFFTDGEFNTRSLPEYQWDQLRKRVRGKSTLGALVRIIVPFQVDEQQQAAAQLGAAFAEATLPEVLEKLRSVRVAS